MEEFVVEECLVAAHQEVDEAEDGEGIVDEGVAAAVALPEEVAVVLVVPGEEPMLSSSPIVTLVCLSQKARSTYLSPKISSLENPSMARSVSPSLEKPQIPKLNTVFGILSVRSSLLVFLAVWKTFSLALAKRFSTLVLLVVLASVMLQMLLVR